MRPLVIVLALLAVACTAEPKSIRLERALPERVFSMEPIALPRAVALDEAGKELSAKLNVTVEPPGYVQVQGDRLMPFTPGDIAIVWRAANGVEHRVELGIRPVDEIKLTCLPRCAVRAGESITIQRTAFAKGEALFEIEVPLALVGEGATLEANVVSAKKPGKLKVNAALGGTTASLPIEFTHKPDRLELKCGTVFTKTRTEEGKEFEVCHFTKNLAGNLSVQTFAGETPVDEPIKLNVLNERMATVANRQVTPLKAGRTSLRASAESDPFVRAEMGIEIGEPRARSRLYRNFYRRRYRGARGRAWARYYAKACPSWESFNTRAYVNLPERKDPAEIYCASRTAVGCVAEASASLTRRGRMEESTIRSWLGPCCCVTTSDRDAIKKERK